MNENWCSLNKMKINDDICYECMLKEITELFETYGIKPTDQIIRMCMLDCRFREQIEREEICHL